MIRTVLVLASLVVLPAPVAAWRIRLPGTFEAGPIALHPKGDVFAAVAIQNRPHERATAVVRVAVRTGKERWRQALRGTGRERSDDVNGLVPMPDGDVVAVGSILDGGYGTFFASRLAGSDGSVRWRRIVHGSQRRAYEVASSVAADARGDLIVAGTLEGTTTAMYHGTTDFAVVKLAGDSGDERWRLTLNGGADQYDYANVVAVDAAGDAVAVGTVAEPIPGESVLFRSTVTVVKLASADGHVIWRSNVDAVWRVGAVVLDAAGDIFMAASTQDAAGNSFGVVKLAGQTGDQIWLARVSESEHHWQEAFQLRLLSSGDVVAVGITADPAGDWFPTVVRLDGSTGAERWRRVLHGSHGGGFGRAIAVSPSGDLLVGGEVQNTKSCQDVSIARLADSSGEVLDVTTVDGRSVARRCEDPECYDDHCGPQLAFDVDTLSTLTVDTSGHLVMAGSLADGPRGQQHGFVARLR